MLLIIDNYDSFTYNLYHYLGELGSRARVVRNDAMSVDEIKALNPSAIVLSPGPCSPNEAGICLELIDALAAWVPIFGVCLGHQAIGQAFGGRVVRAPTLMHGKLSAIDHNGQGVFAGVKSPLTATRYHSLTLEPETLPDVLQVTARTKEGVIMGVQHKSLPVHGVQFHPESIASEGGKEILQNFLNLAKSWKNDT